MVNLTSIYSVSSKVQDIVDMVKELFSYRFVSRTLRNEWWSILRSCVHSLLFHVIHMRLLCFHLIHWFKGTYILRSPHHISLRDLTSWRDLRRFLSLREISLFGKNAFWLLFLCMLLAYDFFIILIYVLVLYRSRTNREFGTQSPEVLLFLVIF